MNKIINGITEVTNGHFRELEYLVRNDDFKLVEFDNTTMNDDIESIPCFKYKDDYYGLDEIMRASEECLHDGYIGFSYFNGLYIDLNKNNDCVKITYFHK